MYLRPGHIFANRYEIKKEFHGGMAQVFGAYDLKEKRYVVLKFLPPTLANDEQAKNDLINEAKIAAKVKGKNILQIYGAFKVKSSGEVFIIMEWVKGCDLATLIKNHGPFTWDEARPVLEQILSGLEAIHSAGIIHRDIKPQNILIREDGTVLVADFGISKSIQSSMTRISQVTSISGTPAYMAPEAIKGEKIGRATDIYAVGCIAYEMLTGHPPFTGNPMTVMWKHVHEEPDYSVLPKEAVEWVKWCLAKSVEQRPVSARIALTSLCNTEQVPHYTSEGNSESEKTFKITPSTPTGKKARAKDIAHLLIVPLALVLVISIGTLIYRSFQTNSTITTPNISQSSFASSNGTSPNVLPSQTDSPNSHPSIQFAVCLGGGACDRARSIQQTSDGGFIVAGFTASDEGNVSGYHGGYRYDFWVVKLSSTGVMEWQKCLGGSSDDRAFSVQQTDDGGYIVAGYTVSNDGDVSGNHDGEDSWVVKLSSTGGIEWQKCLGGRGYDCARSIQQTVDGGYIVAGYTVSNGGDVSGNHGGEDFWVVKLSSTGVIEWQKCLGGDDDDRAYSIQQTADGGFIVTGFTCSNDGDVSGNHGNADFWVVKLSSTGVIEWQKCLGGSNDDQAYSVQQTVDGGFIVAGETYSNDGDVSGNHGVGFDDFWVVKLSSAGVIEWQKCLGGTWCELAFSVQQTDDGGFIVAGYTTSNDGDVNGNHAVGCDDFWVVKLSPKGK